MARTSSRSSTTRAASSRAAEQRQVPQTNHISAFYIPPEAIPANMTYRWVAVAHDSAGTPNQQNWQAKYTAGWRPVPRSRHMDLFPKMPNVGFGDDTDDIINRGGQILCEKPTADVERDREILEARADQQRKAVDWMQAPGENPFMPRIDKSSSTFGHSAEFKE